MSFMKKNKTLDTRKKFKNPYTKKSAKLKEFTQHNGGIKKIFAVIFIGFLIIADYFAMYQLFFDPEYDLPLSSVIFYSLMFAAFLEGLPTVCSFFLSIIIDKNIDEVGKKFRSAIGFILSLLAMFAVFYLSINLRLLQIKSHGGAENNPSYLVEVFLVFEPIFSSVLAFVVSWMAFASNYITEKKSRVDNLTQISDAHTREYEDITNIYNSMRRELWNDLLLTNRTFIDKEWNEYCEITYAAIHEKVIWDCINLYPFALKKFNESVVETLQELIFEMSKLTPIELNIASLDIQKILNDFDSTRKGINAWDYNECAGPLTKKLLSFLLKNFGTDNYPKDPAFAATEYTPRQKNEPSAKKRDISAVLDIDSMSKNPYADRKNAAESDKNINQANSNNVNNSDIFDDKAKSDTKADIFQNSNFSASPIVTVKPKEAIVPDVVDAILPDSDKKTTDENYTESADEDFDASVDELVDAIVSEENDSDSDEE